MRGYPYHTYHVVLQVCSVEAAKQFVEKLPASDKKISLYEVHIIIYASKLVRREDI
jgi:hypothetical protein